MRDSVNGNDGKLSGVAGLGGQIAEPGLHVLVAALNRRAGEAEARSIAPANPTPQSSEAIRQLLGPERYADFQRAQENDYQQTPRIPIASICLRKRPCGFMRCAARPKRGDGKLGMTATAPPKNAPIF